MEEGWSVALFVVSAVRTKEPGKRNYRMYVCKHSDDDTNRFFITQEQMIRLNCVDHLSENIVYQIVDAMEHTSAFYY